MGGARSHRAWLRVHCFKPPQSRNERLDTVFDVQRQNAYTRYGDAWLYLLGWIGGLPKYVTQTQRNSYGRIHPAKATSQTAAPRSPGRHLLKLTTHTICHLGTVQNRVAPPEQLAYEYIIATAV